ncbi:hypothetical protein FEM48_Zijuj06G0120000 [Ziziphus jujuba var. spinosa]|uniref:UBL3-like ubiquitin domain-containing protein n=1 Tax=Ziziphus jujuba var. spinosa TaxID=714518 RepID=A0A978V961_ZIZJJ|nr:hypothetical protein FEM48_Zijuj06G0120000 [Ziziphus jujuba var. spinosa]
MAGQDSIELKFRLSDGSDIGPSKYSPSTTVATLKEKILAQWPKVFSIVKADIGSALKNAFGKLLLAVIIKKENGPRTVNDLKLINAGKVLENNRTLAESRLPLELPGGVITMHVVVRPPLSDKNNDPVNKNDRASSVGVWTEFCLLDMRRCKSKA